MKLAIADPPYPPFIGTGGRKNRASRWYGTGQRSRTDKPPDQHPDAAEWDHPSRHRRLLEELLGTYHGFAICTSPDGLAAYGALPAPCRIGAWIKPNAAPGAHRMRSTWEPVIIYPPDGRRSNRGGIGAIPDHHIEPINTRAFRGAKPPGYVSWILQCLSYDPAQDTIDDLFPGSGAIQIAINAYAKTPRQTPR